MPEVEAGGYLTSQLLIFGLQPLAERLAEDTTGERGAQIMAQAAEEVKDEALAWSAGVIESAREGQTGWALEMLDGIAEAVRFAAWVENNRRRSTATRHSSIKNDSRRFGPA